MLDGDAPHLVGEVLQIGLPGAGRFCVDLVVKAVEKMSDHALEKVFSAGHVAIQRHGFDAKVLPQPPHRQTLCTLAVDGAQRSLNDHRPVQTLACSVACDFRWHRRLLSPLTSHDAIPA